MFNPQRQGMKQKIVRVGTNSIQTSVSVVRRGVCPAARTWARSPTTRVCGLESREYVQLDADGIDG